MINPSLLIDKNITAKKIDKLLSLQHPKPQKPSLSIGFPPPYHLIFSSHNNTFSLSHNPSLLADINTLPFPDSSLGTIFLYTSPSLHPEPRKTLREIWRVLDENGFILLVTSSHRNRWLLSPHDPLKKESGYSLSIVSKLLHDQLFSLLSLQRCLHAHPLIRHLPIPHPQFPIIADHTAKIITPAFGGLILALAKKNVAEPIFHTSHKTKILFSHAS